ncbi:MAG: hypothetical protein LLF98_02710 [Clostridium sp.]|uniref:hypothetical protein n=1 Tax=Clostridium sp. TaxID=1506 RepID=UPI0025B9107F|nr:hypothetical protein [Clostridium sp.]MCE5220195.1 hypothetical protein [Clostridium sp.]
MSDTFPLYPSLSEEGELEAQELLNDFTTRIKKIMHDAIEETVGEFYSDIIPHIESDSWNNFRNYLMAGFKDYNNRKIQGSYDFKEIRQQIYKEFREDIIKDLDQDNLKEIEKLKKQIEFMHQCERNRY